MKTNNAIDHGFHKQRRLVRLFSFLILSILLYVVFSAVLSLLLTGIANLNATLKNSGTEPPPLFLWRYLVVPYGISPLPVVLITLMVSLLGFIRVSNFALRIIKPKTMVEGSSRWATKKEIRKYLFPVPKNDLASATKSGIILAADEKNYYIDSETVNSLTVGATRSGKGQFFVLPTIRFIALSGNKHSMLLNDPKGELAENSYYLLKNAGYKVVILNFREPKNSSRWNPLSIIIQEYIDGINSEDGDISKACELVGELALTLTQNKHSDPIWPESAKSLLSAIILYLLEEGYKHNCLDRLNMYSVNTFLCEFGSKIVVVNKRETTQLDIFFENLPIGNPAKLAYTTSNFAKGEMRSSIFSTLASNLQIFTDTGIASLTAANDITIDDLVNPDRPCAIFMVVPDEKTNRHVLASLFITQCYSRLVDIASHAPRQKLKQRVMVLLDEFSNMTRIPDFETKISVSLGRNILFNLFIQDIEQLEGKYDKSTAKTIIGNCGNYIYINSLSKETNEHTSAILGKQTVEYQTYMGDLTDVVENRLNTHLKGRELMTPDELGRMEFGEAVVIRQRCYPIRTKIDPFFKLDVPIIPIFEMEIPRSTVSYKDTLFPFALLNTAPVYVPPAPVSDEIREADDHTQNAHLSKMNTLTEGRFGSALQTGEFDQCKKMIDGYLFRKKISQPESMLLRTIVSEFRDKAMVPVGQILLD